MVHEAILQGLIETLLCETYPKWFFYQQFKQKVVKVHLNHYHNYIFNVQNMLWKHSIFIIKYKILWKCNQKYEKNVISKWNINQYFTLPFPPNPFHKGGWVLPKEIDIQVKIRDLVHYKWRRICFYLIQYFHNIVLIIRE